MRYTNFIPSPANQMLKIHIEGIHFRSEPCLRYVESSELPDQIGMRYAGKFYRFKQSGVGRRIAVIIDNPFIVIPVIQFIFEFDPEGVRMVV